MSFVRSRTTAPLALVRNPNARTIRPRSYASLGDWFTDWTSNTAESSPACDAAGQAAQAPYYAQMTDLKNTWTNRTGFWAIRDAQAIIQNGLALQVKGQAMIDSIRAAYGETVDVSVKQGIDQAQNDLFAIGQVAMQFQAAITQAVAANATVLDATGLSGYVIDAIGACGQAAYLQAYLSCALFNVGASLVPLADLLAAASAVYNVAKAAALVVYQTGQVVYKTTVGALDLAATIVKYAPYIAAGMGLLWLAKMAKER